MKRFLLFALMCCMYGHALITGFRIGIHTKVKDKIANVTVEGKDILWMLALLGCAAAVACTIRL